MLAGGTDLISLMKEYLDTPKRVVNIKNIKELGGIQKTADGCASAPSSPSMNSPKNADVKAGCQSLSDAARGVPSPQIRNMGTVGGDLCQRPRCWYFRQGFGLLAMKDGKTLVPDGENQYHAIFGSGPAYFVSASSLGPALVALGAKIKLVSATVRREVAGGEILRHAAERDLARDRPAAQRDPHRDRDSGRRRAQRHLRSPAEGGARLASGHRHRSCSR